MKRAPTITPAGVASILEATATLNRLIKEGKLPRPKRTIRMLAMGERYGTLAYLDAHQDRTKRTIAAMCIDTPAGWQYLAGTQFDWSMNPQSASSFVDAFDCAPCRGIFPHGAPPLIHGASTTGPSTTAERTMTSESR